jgi:hypothetical protein
MLPLTENAYEELTSLQTFLQSVTYDEAAKDKWAMIWGLAYSSSKFYKTVFQSVDAHPIFNWVWKSRCTNRVKLFAWLVLVDRLNTRSMLKRRHHLVKMRSPVLCAPLVQKRTYITSSSNVRLPSNVGKKSMSLGITCRASQPEWPWQEVSPTQVSSWKLF